MDVDTLVRGMLGVSALMMASGGAMMIHENRGNLMRFVFGLSFGHIVDAPPAKTDVGVQFRGVEKTDKGYRATFDIPGGDPAKVNAPGMLSIYLVPEGTPVLATPEEFVASKTFPSVVGTIGLPPSPGGGQTFGLDLPDVAPGRYSGVVVIGYEV